MLTLKPSLLDIKRGHLILDLGCGEGRHLCGLLERSEDCSLVGVDLNFKDLLSTKEKINTWHQSKADRCTLVQSNGLTLPFEDETFDHIICSEVLEHIDHYSKMLNEITRLLKPGGKLCVSVPRAWPERICWYLSEEYHQIEGGHLRIFNRGELQSEIQSLGFHLTRMHWAHALHTPYWWLKCLFWKRKKETVLVSLYHKLLVWDLMKKPWLTQTVEGLLNPLMGKSVVMYFQKAASI